MSYFLALMLAFFVPSTDAASLNDLQTKAGESNKNIVVYFSGSDWCVNCFRFHDEVLANADIKNTIDNGFIFYNADFPQRKKQQKEVVQINKELAEKLNPQGIFPLLVVVDKELNVKVSFHKREIEQIKTALTGLSAQVK